MIRRWMMQSTGEKKETPTSGFRVRGQEVSRLESFSDAVFGFAITLLVVSLTPPDTFNGLLQAVDRLPGFGVSFAALVLIWYYHYLFFRRYGLADHMTVVLNTVLLFVILFYVYPLRFLFFFLFTSLTSQSQASQLVQHDQQRILYTLYSAGFIAVFLIFALLYGHAYRLRGQLDLNDLETFDTLTAMWINLAICAVGALSIALAFPDVTLSYGLPGVVYLLITPVVIVVQRARRGRRATVAQRITPEQASQVVGAFPDQRKGE